MARLIELIRQGALKPVKPRFNTFNIDGVELSVDRLFLPPAR